MSAGGTEAEKGYIMRTQARTHHAGLRARPCPKSTAAKPTETANIKIQPRKTSNSQTGERKHKKRHIQKGSPPQFVQRYPGTWRAGMWPATHPRSTRRPCFVFVRFWW